MTIGKTHLTLEMREGLLNGSQSRDWDFELFHVPYLDESCVVTADSIFVLLQALMKIGQKNECVFPLIDLIRLMIKNYSVNTLLCGESSAEFRNIDINVFR